MRIANADDEKRTDALCRPCFSGEEKVSSMTRALGMQSKTSGRNRSHPIKPYQTGPIGGPGTCSHGPARPTIHSYFSSARGARQTRETSTLIARSPRASSSASRDIGQDRLPVRRRLLSPNRRDAVCTLCLSPSTHERRCGAAQPRRHTFRVLATLAPHLHAFTPWCAHPQRRPHSIL